MQRLLEPRGTKAGSGLESTAAFQRRAHLLISLLTPSRRVFFSARHFKEFLGAHPKGGPVSRYSAPCATGCLGALWGFPGTLLVVPPNGYQPLKKGLPYCWTHPFVARVSFFTILGADLSAFVFASVHFLMVSCKEQRLVLPTYRGLESAADPGGINEILGILGYITFCFACCRTPNKSPVKTHVSFSSFSRRISMAKRSCHLPLTQRNRNRSGNPHLVWIGGFGT